MRSGRLRHRIDIQHDTSGAGDENPIWKLFLGNQPANVLDVTGGEVYRGRQLQAETTHVVEMRWNDKIKSAMRIKDHLGRILSIDRPPMDFRGRQREMMLQCKEDAD